MALIFESRHTVELVGPHSLAMLMIVYLSSGVHEEAVATQFATAAATTVGSLLQLVLAPAGVSVVITIGTSL